MSQQLVNIYENSNFRSVSRIPGKDITPRENPCPWCAQAGLSPQAVGTLCEVPMVPIREEHFTGAQGFVIT